MSAEFPTLAEVLRQHRVKVRHGRYWVGQCTGCAWTTDQPMGFMAGVLDAHEAHQGDAWREACTIRTAEQLNALPDGAIVADCHHSPVYKQDGIWWFGSQRAAIVPPYGFPALLIHHPDWAQS